VRTKTFDGPVEIEIGDGIDLFNRASAAMKGNIVTENGRFGLIVDNADVSATTLENNTFNDNVEYGIILQNQDGQLDISINVTVGNVLGAALEDPATPFPTQRADFRMRATP
jgi:parallel beta-helix repeat protein